jgi:hypothetical protein
MGGSFCYQEKLESGVEFTKACSLIFRIGNAKKRHGFRLASRRSYPHKRIIVTRPSQIFCTALRLSYRFLRPRSPVSTTLSYVLVLRELKVAERYVCDTTIENGRFITMSTR